MIVVYILGVLSGAIAIWAFDECLSWKESRGK